MEYSLYITWSYGIVIGTFVGVALWILRDEYKIRDDLKKSGKP
jgi:heme exporter protein CcmD